MHIHPDDVSNAQKAIDQALQLNPNDPFVQALAGKLAYRGKNFDAAILHLSAAIRVRPEMVEAHEALSATYRAVGEKNKSETELKEVLRIKATETANPEPPSEASNLLFGIRTPPPVNVTRPP
jgi:uncharacterized protein HemY